MSRHLVDKPPAWQVWSYDNKTELSSSKRKTGMIIPQVEGVKLANAVTSCPQKLNLPVHPAQTRPGPVTSARKDDGMASVCMRSAA
jgi:hypothetical protein